MSQSNRLFTWNRHIMRVLTLLMFLVCGTLSLAWMPAPQSNGTAVTGDVTNGTVGASVPGDLTVAIHTFSDMAETSTYTTTLTGGQSFEFENLRLREGDTVVARVVYDGVTYVSEFVSIDQEQEAISLPITVYETTQDASNISIAQLHLFVNSMGERIKVGEYVVLGNTGDRTYVDSLAADGPGATWTATLPEGADNLQFDGANLGERFVSLSGGFSDTRPIPPGEGSVETSFTYELPFREGMEIQQSFDVPVRAAVLVLPEAEWRLQGADISAEETIDTQMGTALSYTAGPFSAGEPLSFQVVARRSAAQETEKTPSSNGLALGIGALVLAAAAVTVMWRSPFPGRVPLDVRPDVEAIAALDRDFESGKLNESVYRKKRAELKRRLRQALPG